MHCTIATWAPTSFMNKFKPLSERTIMTRRQWFTRRQESAPESPTTVATEDWSCQLISSMHRAPHAPGKGNTGKHGILQLQAPGLKVFLYIVRKHLNVLYSKLFDFQCQGRICTNCKSHCTDECVIKRRVFLLSTQKTMSTVDVHQGNHNVHWMSPERTSCAEVELRVSGCLGLEAKGLDCSWAWGSTSGWQKFSGTRWMSAQHSESIENTEVEIIEMVGFMFCNLHLNKDWRGSCLQVLSQGLRDHTPFLRSESPLTTVVSD